MIENEKLIVKDKVSGVALVIKNSRWEILSLLEKEDKVWKRAKQLSIPMETKEQNDKNWQDVIKRCLQEEIWLSDSEINRVLDYFIDRWNITFYVKKNEFNYFESEVDLKRVDLQIFFYEWDFFNSVNFSNWEVGNVKMSSLNSIIFKFFENPSSVRPGVIESILKALSSSYRPSIIPIIEKWIYTPDSLKYIWLDLKNYVKEQGPYQNMMITNSSQE